MTIDLNKLIPIAVMAAIAWHSKGAVQERLENLTKAQQNIVAQAEIQSILRVARIQSIADEKFQITNFRDFIRGNIKRAINSQDPSIDPWGRPYRHHFHRGKLTIKSAGPDTLWNTEDDIENSEIVVRQP